MNRLLLWLAQGFGIGRVPVAPGTFGSLLGLAWFTVLLIPRNVWLFSAGIVAGLALSVWLCDVGEKLLNRKDPGSVVIDEIAAMPLCFAGWVGFEFWKSGSVPGPGYFWSGHAWLWSLGVFAAFRLFDITKPWPARQSQALPGGWGITVDDTLAAIYVNLVAVPILWWIGKS